jgi:DNA sulfur modification protein DndB
MEKTSISNRSVKLFTLSSIYQATQALLRKKKTEEVSEEEERIAIDYWNEVAKHIPDWQLAKERKVSPAALRRDYIHSHGLALQVLGRVGADLLSLNSKTWRKKLKKMASLDWSRENAQLWEGRALVGGRVSKAHNSVILTTNILKEVLGLPLSADEKRVEKRWEKGAI